MSVSTADFATQRHFAEPSGDDLHLSPTQIDALRGARQWSFELPAWLRMESIFGYWGRDPSSLSERCDGNRISWSSHSQWGPIRIDGEVKEDAGGRQLHLQLHSQPDHDPPPFLAAYAHRLVLGFLGLHMDPRRFEEELLQRPDQRLIVDRRGLTLPQTASVFDAALWVVVGQQVSLAAAFSIRRRLTERFGTPIAGLVTSPSVAAIAEADLADLNACGLTRRKSEYLRGLAQLAQPEPPQDGVTPLAGLEGWRQWPQDEAESNLMAIRGFGAWSAGYMQMRALGFADCVPLGDAALRNALVRYYDLDTKPDRDKTLELMERFRPYRSLATFHLWASLATPQ